LRLVLGVLDGSAERGVGWSGRFRVAVIAAVAGGLLGGVGRPAAVSAGGGWEGFEPGERGGELGGPWPVVLEA
jgi:hypothetical protein